MTDIWDEKPDPACIRHGITKYYLQGEMDAWLKKLKAHYTLIEEKADAMLRFRKAAEDLGEYAADLKDKLDAVKVWHEAQLDCQVDSTDIKELGEILEAEM